MEDIIISKDMSINNKKIGIIGATMQDDYGLIMSHMGLCEFLKTRGVNFSIIPSPYTKNYCKTSIPLFKKMYPISKKISLSSFTDYNKEFDTFLLGPGEVWDWNFYVTGCADMCSYLKFVDNTKKIITYGPTFKWDYPTVLISRPDKHLEYKKQLKRFNNITVTSQGDSDILNDFYDIKDVKPVIDAMFLPPRKFFLDFINYQPKQIKNTLTIYPINKISRNETADNCAKMLRCDIQKIATGNPYECQRLKDYSIVLDDITILNPPGQHLSIRDWLKQIIYSRYVMCCDYSSLCVAIRFMKNFIVFQDPDDTRIEFLINKLGLQERMIENHDHEKAIKLFKTKIDWISVYEKLKSFKKESIISLLSSIK